jgi:predicted PurR-regulated permease PerM
VAIYVLVVGGIAVLGWVGITKLAKTIRTASTDLAAALREDGHRAEFLRGVVPASEAVLSGAPPDRDIVIPKGTEIEAGEARYRTLYAVHLEPGEVRSVVLLEHVGPDEGDRPPLLAGTAGRLVRADAPRYGDGKPLSERDAARLTVQAGGAATGLEYFAERRLISPIVTNLAAAGYEVEPDLVRDYVRLKAETLKEDLPGRLGKGAFSVAGSVVLSIYTFFLILMLTAFIVTDRRGIARFFASLPPPRYQPAYATLMRYVDDGLAGVIRGQLVICGVNGVLTYFGLVVLGVPYALLLASVAAILSLIPVFGTILSSIPIVLIGATKGLDVGLLALLWIVLIHLIEANLLNPLIMGSHARMHPVVIIFALLAGEHAFGVWGALLAVPTASVIQSCFRFYLHEVEGIPFEPHKPHGEWLRRFFRSLKERFAPSRGEGGA